MISCSIGLFVLVFFIKKKKKVVFFLSLVCIIACRFSLSTNSKLYGPLSHQFECKFVVHHHVVHLRISSIKQRALLCNSLASSPINPQHHHQPLHITHSSFVLPPQQQSLKCQTSMTITDYQASHVRIPSNTRVMIKLPLYLIHISYH